MAGRRAGWRGNTGPILLGKGTEVVVEGRVKRREMKPEQAEKEKLALEQRKTDMRISKVIRHRVRYFTDGAVIGGRSFVDGVFRDCREDFGPRRQSGARKPRGALGSLAGEVGTARDQRTGFG